MRTFSGVRVHMHLLLGITVVVAVVFHGTVTAQPPKQPGDTSIELRKLRAKMEQDRKEREENRWQWVAVRLMLVPVAFALLYVLAEAAGFLRRKIASLFWNRPDDNQSVSNPSPREQENPWSEHWGPCSGCGFAYRYDGERCSKCGLVRSKEGANSPADPRQEGDPEHAEPGAAPAPLEREADDRNPATPSATPESGAGLSVWKEIASDADRSSKRE